MRFLTTLILAGLVTGCADNSADPPPAQASSSEAASPPQASPAPTDEAGLTGTWTHVATADTPGGARTPMTSGDISWTFQADGTGTYSQQVDVLGSEPRTRAFNWSLDGDTIDLGGATYTIAERNGDEMVWRNDLLGDYYIVQRN